MTDIHTIVSKKYNQRKYGKYSNLAGYSVKKFTSSHNGVTIQVQASTMRHVTSQYPHQRSNSLQLMGEYSPSGHWVSHSRTTPKKTNCSACVLNNPFMSLDDIPPHIARPHTVKFKTLS